MPMEMQHSPIDVKKAHVGKLIARSAERAAGRRLPECAIAEEDRDAAEWRDLFVREGLDLRDPKIARSAFLVSTVLDLQMTAAIHHIDGRLAPELRDVCVSIVSALHALARFVN